jgi:pyrroloquinoline quinone biosynthesis protein D
VTPQCVPYLPRGVRLSDDPLRGLRVLLGPERVLMLDQIGDAVLSRVDGARSVRAISEDLALTFAAPRDEIETDVLAYLGDLADKRLLETRHG